MTDARVGWFMPTLEHELPRWIATAFRDGGCFVSRALSPAGLEHLLRWSAHVELYEAQRRVGPVRQHASIAVLAGSAFDGAIVDEFICAFGQLVRTRTPSPMRCAGYTPNEATLMAYQGPAAGISAHLDGKRYLLLVAIFSLAGDGQLELLDERAGTKSRAAWRCAPGDLVLLRAPGLGGVPDGRPMHRVGAARSDTRMSLTLRMDAGRLADEIGSTLNHEPESSRSRK